MSTIVLKSGARLDAIDAGKSDIATRTYERAMQWFSDHWPPDAAWPKDIPRPTPAKTKATATDTSGLRENKTDILTEADHAET